MSLSCSLLTSFLIAVTAWHWSPWVAYIALGWSVIGIGLIVAVANGYSSFTGESLGRVKPLRRG